MITKKSFRYHKLNKDPRTLPGTNQHHQVSQLNLDLVVSPDRLLIADSIIIIIIIIISMSLRDVITIVVKKGNCFISFAVSIARGHEITNPTNAPCLGSITQPCRVSSPHLE